MEKTSFKIETIGFDELRDVLLLISLKIKAEDWQIVRDIVRPEMARTLGRDVSMEEALHACLTYGIHQAYQDATGKPFVLRMDRPKN